MQTKWINTGSSGGLTAYLVTHSAVIASVIISLIAVFNHTPIYKQQSLSSYSKTPRSPTSGFQKKYTPQSKNINPRPENAVFLV